MLAHLAHENPDEPEPTGDEGQDDVQDEAGQSVLAAVGHDSAFQDSSEVVAAGGGVESFDCVSLRKFLAAPSKRAML